MTDKELRELDVEIAIKVFGYKWALFSDGISQLEPHTSKWIERHGGKWVDSPSGELDTVGAPHYTTDPAAAMAVLEKCAEKCCLTMEMIYYDGPHWRIYVEDIDGAAYAPTLPLAIALFAKKLYEH
jgi:hypothetical protein